mmetsp:Transcript_62080/g.161285  ORF Transcript_62080/g.161285 Transcript_62080/m.161285 type:complete len:131 (+) Transcript_62080:491-883(+)
MRLQQLVGCHHARAQRARQRARPVYGLSSQSTYDAERNLRSRLCDIPLAGCNGKSRTLGSAPGAVSHGPGHDDGLPANNSVGSMSCRQCRAARALACVEQPRKPADPIWYWLHPQPSTKLRGKTATIPAE